MARSFFDSVRRAFAGFVERLRAFRPSGQPPRGAAPLVAAYKAAAPPVPFAAGILLRPPAPTAPVLPRFDFRPSDDFAAAMGAGAAFTVANPLDLALPGRSLVASVLVVEVAGPSTARTILWLRFDSALLVADGVSACRFFTDQPRDDDTGSAPLEWVGVCGWVMDRSRV